MEKNLAQFFIDRVEADPSIVTNYSIDEWKRLISEIPLSQLSSLVKHLFIHRRITYAIIALRIAYPYTDQRWLAAPFITTIDKTTFDEITRYFHQGINLSRLIRDCIDTDCIQWRDIVCVIKHICTTFKYELQPSDLVYKIPTGPAWLMYKEQLVKLITPKFRHLSTVVRGIVNHPNTTQAQREHGNQIATQLEDPMLEVVSGTDLELQMMNWFHDVYSS